MQNRLADENSPYLLQHADNPVDWYPWGAEALAKARQDNKPILLSIGYAACHWCHVMAHESFEDQDTAAIMNREFVNIKVDREERPDLDSIYMTAVQAMTGHGGWPMTVFLTPQGEPFYGGTYYPPVPRHGMPAFQQVLQSVADAWASRELEVAKSAAEIAGQLDRTIALAAPAGALRPALLDQALSAILNRFDGAQGGFGPAPKFPPSMTIEFLLRIHAMRGDGMALHMAELTLEKMAYSGMYDQLGGGFARYATDEHWLVPHFEKMLYDNALLARVYLHAYQVTGNRLYRRITEETLDFVARELRHADGGFYSSYDADSEGVEGKFYVWEADEIRAQIGDEAPLFMSYYGVTDQGNWEGHNILNMARPPETVAAEFGLEIDALDQRIEKAKRQLLAARAQRAWPGLDDKVLTAWNGLMLAAFAEAGRVLDRADYKELAAQNANFLWRAMRTADGRLLRTWKAGGQAKYNAYLEDYAFLADGLLALYQTTFDERWYRWALELVEIMLAHFSDAENGGFFDTSDDHEALLHRPKEIQDNATPSANAMAAHVLLQLSLLGGEMTYWERAETTVAALEEVMGRYPTGFAHWLCAATFILGEPREVAIAGALDDDRTQALLKAVSEPYFPHLVRAAGENGRTVPLLADRPLRDGQPTAYVCRRFLCEQPVITPEALAGQLRKT